MRFNRLTVALLTLFTGFVLAACQQPHHPKSSSTASSEPSSSSENPNQPEKKATMKNYTVPATDKRNPHYQKSGLLQLPGEFSYDKVGTKLTLKTTRKGRYQVHSKGLQITFTQVKVISNQAKTDQALAMAKQALSMPELPNPYQTIQLKFTVKNYRHRAVLTDGIKGIKLNSGASVTTASGLNDPSAGQLIPANGQRTFSAMAFAGPKGTTTTPLTIQFSGSFTTAGQPLSPHPDPLEFRL